MRSCEDWGQALRTFYVCVCVCVRTSLFFVFSQRNVLVYYVFYARHSFVNDVWRCWPMKQTYLEPVFVCVTILSVLIRTYTVDLGMILLCRNCVVAGKTREIVLPKQMNAKYIEIQ